MSRLKESTLGQSDICDLWITLRDALGSPEVEKGVVHADTHPGNVIVSEDGALKVLSILMIAITDQLYLTCL